MTSVSEPEIFDENLASSYDEKTDRISPIKDSLHLLSQLVLKEIPENSKILCVGSGTGAELFYLASAFPQWHFTAVEPAKAMIDISRQRAIDFGIGDRVEFHEGYLSTLEDRGKYDAATSILVSQFLLDEAERLSFFRQIASRLKPGGYLINADLSTDLNETDHEKLMDVWMRMLEFSGMKVEREVYGRDVAVSKPKEIEQFMLESGFDAPIQFSQNFFIRAWFSRLKEE
mgnify:CR=1 FL=1